MIALLRAFVCRGNCIILAVLVIAAGLVSEHFWSIENILNVIRAASLIGIIAIGMNVVMIGAGIDLSVGSIVALTGTVAAALWVADAPFPLFIAIPLLVALAVGFANGALISGLGLQPFLATLVLMAIARGAGLIYTGGQPIYADYPDVFMLLSRGALLGLPIPALLFLVIALFSWHLMRWRVFGREVYAIGANETAARLSGINVGWVKCKTYLYCALLAGISGLVLTSRMESGQPGQAGIFWELDAIAAVVIGGTALKGGSGSIWGAVVGALIIGIVANLFNLLGIGPAWQQIAKGGIILLAVLLQAFSDSGGLKSLSMPRLPTLAISWRSMTTLSVLLLLFNGILAQTAPALFAIDPAKAPYTRANNLELTRVYRRAIPLYEEVIARFPDSEYALRSRIGIANSARGSGELAEAEKIYADLLQGIENGAVPAALRLDILKNYAALLQETADAVAFEAVYAELERHYPENDATREAGVFLDQLRAAAKTGGIAEDAPVIATADGVRLADTARVGQRIDLVIEVAPNGEKSADFSLLTSLAFWQGFKLIRILPNPRSNTEFWGRRAWRYGRLSGPITITATLEAIKAGAYELDLDIEQSFRVLEYGIVKSIRVEE